MLLFFEESFFESIRPFIGLFSITDAAITGPARQPYQPHQHQQSFIYKIATSSAKESKPTPLRFLIIRLVF